MKFVELKELHAKVQVTLHCPIYNSMNMSKKSYGVWKLMFFSFVVSLQKCFCRNNGENLLELNTFQGREMGQPPARTALFIRQHKCDKIQPGPSMEGPDECIRTNSPPLFYLPDSSKWVDLNSRKTKPMEQIYYHWPDDSIRIYFSFT